MIHPGLGIPGVIELGWGPEMVKARLGKGKKVVFRNRECVRFTERYRHYMDLDLDVYVDRYVDPWEIGPQCVDWLTFGPHSRGATTAGITVGRSTRADVYAAYGPDLPNPNAFYDTLGIAFAFDHLPHTPHLPNDTVVVICVYPSRPLEE